MKIQNWNRGIRINKSTAATVMMCGLLVTMMGAEVGVAPVSASILKAGAQSKAAHITMARIAQPAPMGSVKARVWLATDVPPVPPTIKITKPDGSIIEVTLLPGMIYDANTGILTFPPTTPPTTPPKPDDKSDLERAIDYFKRLGEKSTNISTLLDILGKIF